MFIGVFELDIVDLVARVVGMGTLDQRDWGSTPDARLVSKGCGS